MQNEELREAAYAAISFNIHLSRSDTVILHSSFIIKHKRCLHLKTPVKTID